MSSVFRSAALLLACALSTSVSFAQLSFNPHQAAPLPSGSAIGAHGDFNNDGREDIVATVFSPSASVYVPVLYLSTADGTYDAPKSLPAFVDAIGDFNHDGKLDFASGEFGSNPISVYLGNGDGTFQAAKSFSGPSSIIQSILAADLNHDNKTDLVELLAGASNGNLNSTLQIWISNGDGTFTAGQSIGTSIGAVASQQAASAVIGDFDGDAKPDIALIYGYVNQNSRSVSVPSTVQTWYGDGAGHLGSPSYFSDPSKNFDAVPAAADLNNDGRSDIVTASSSLSGSIVPTFALFFGNSNRTLTYKPLTNSECAGAFTAADFNGDGFNDLAYTAVPCSNSVQTSVFVRLGTGSGNFGAEENVYQNPYQLGQPYAVRTTLGTKPDIAFEQFNGTTTDSFELLTNDSTGSFPGCGLTDKAEGITVCSPGFTSSPVKFSVAAAGPTPMRTAAVWVDGKKAAEQLTHAFANYSFLDTSLPLSLGSHAITIFGTGWDNTLQSKAFTLTVTRARACTAPAAPGVNICAPVNGSGVNSPVPVQATATVTGTLARIELWVDGVKRYTETASPSLNTTVTLAAGSHRFVFIAVNTVGAKWQNVASATVN